MKTRLIIAAALFIPLSAQAATHHHSHTNRMPAYQPQIACTDVGCMPVPRGCYPTGGKSFSGLPTGYDVVVCSNGTLYGHQ